MQAPADKIAEPLGRGRQGHVPQDAQIHAAGRDIKGCAQLPQTAAVQLPVDELLRDSGHAEADGRQVYQQASGAQLDLRVQMQTVLQEILFQKQPGGRLPLQQDQRELGNLLQGIDMVKVAGIWVVRHGNVSRDAAS